MRKWTIAHIDKASTVELIDWAVYEVQLGSRDAPTQHLVGSRRQNPLGKVSSAIVAVDPVQRRLTTESGQIYELQGDKGHSLGGALVWKTWMTMYGLSVYADITEDFVMLLDA